MLMGWSVNKIVAGIIPKFQFAVAFGISLIPLFLDLDPEKWDDLRKGLDYNEAPLPEMQSGELPAAPVGIGVWLEMLKIVGIILLIILLVFLIVRLIMKSKGPQRSRKSAAGIVAPEQVTPTALSPMELLWKHFQKAKDAGDFRECLRILYQISLKKLGENGWVKPKVDKTNREYLNEIETGDVAREFADLTLIHEYSWYGDTIVKTAEFGDFEPRFMKFINNPALERK